MPDPSPFKTPDFWVAVAIALIVKVKTSAQLGPVKVITTVVVAIGAAWVSAEYFADLLGVPLAISAGLITLTAEGAMRWILIAVNDPRQAIDLWKYWRKP